MPSSDDDTALDPETEAAIRRVVREELDRRDATGLGGVLRAITEFGSGFVIGAIGIATVVGILIATDAPPAAFVVGAVGVLLLIAYGWRLPPFR